MPFSRRFFLTTLLAGINADKVFSRESETDKHSYPHLVHGPMLGAIGPTELNIWARANGHYEVDIQLDTGREFKTPVLASRLMAKPEKDFVTVHKIKGLDSDATYYYRVLVNRGRHLGKWARFIPDLAYLPPFKFKTAPNKAVKTRFRIAFGSCARIQTDAHQAIWDAVALWRPDLFFWLGDNVYGDSQSPLILAGQYRQQRAVSSMQKILREVPQLAIWDDHDYSGNDQDRTNPTKAASLNIFKRYWANPDYGLPDTPGIFFNYNYGGVDFFFLDGRYYRAPNEEEDDKNKSMLGTEQKAWLKSGLKKSKAPFKLLICGSGWSSAGGFGDDSWSSFMTERNEIFNFIRDEKITGVVLLSGDTHVGELNAIPWSEQGGYDLYDLVSSPLAQNTSQKFVNQKPEVRIRKPYSGSTNFGVIDFDMTAQIPTLTFRLVGSHGGAVWQPLSLRANELINGVMTWQRKSLLK